MQGAVTLFARYTPWGDSLELHGTGNFSFGYLGSVLDATTGLLYVGNGQYGVYPERSRRDLSTGRFLTREVYPNRPNPYVPWNPIGAIVGPLGVIALVFGRRKKGSKAGALLVLVVVVGSVGMTLAGCGGEQPAPGPLPQPTAVPSNNNAPANPNPNETPQPGPGTDAGKLPSSTPSPVVTLTLPECPTPTWTPTPKDILTMPFPGKPAYNEYGAWEKTLQKYKDVRDWMIANAPEDLELTPDSSGYGLRFKDEVLLTIIVTIEFRSYSDQRIFSDLLGALYNQYQSPIFCGGNCSTVEKQLVWLSNKQGIRVASVDWITRWYPRDRHWGTAVKRGDYAGRQGWEWGNYTPGSPFDLHPDKYPNVNYLDRQDGNYAGIVVFTAEQDQFCGNCLGW